MATTTVRVSRQTHDALAELAARDGVPIAAKVAELVDRAREEEMLAGHVAAMERLRDDPQRWEAWQTEMRELEATLTDGLDDQ